MPNHRAARGTIASIRPNRGDGRGFGSIAPDGGGPDLCFDNGSVEGPAQALGHALRRVWRTKPGPERSFDRLCVGQRVTFAIGVDPRQPHRPRAEQLRPCGEQE
jgi:cold shock CspA family protein